MMSSEASGGRQLTDQEKEALSDILTRAGLSYLKDNFLREKVSVDLVPQLSDEQLTKLGVQCLGDGVLLKKMCSTSSHSEKVTAEVKGIFGHGEPSQSGGKQSHESLIARATRLCHELRTDPSKVATSCGRKRKHHNMKVKGCQKNLVHLLEEISFVPVSLKDVVMHMQQYLKPERYEFHIRRGQVLDDLLEETRKLAFHPLKRVQTWFIGEVGSNTGGLTRELWRLLGLDVMRLCEGQPNILVLRHDSDRVLDGDFRRIGMLIGMSLIQGGSGYPFFAPAVYDYICGQEVCNIVPTIDEIPDAQLKTALVELSEAKEDGDIRRIAMNACDLFLDCGVGKPLMSMTQKDVPQLVKIAALHSCIMKVKAELDQFVAGLKEAQVLDVIRKYPSFFHPMFVASQTDTVTAEIILNLLKHKVFSEPGSRSFLKEQTTYVFFRDLLEEVECGDLEIISMGSILSFFTGADHIPPLGFDEATLNFSDNNPYPTASTCALCLTLPTKYHGSYADFKENFTFAMRNHGGFGLL